MESGGCRGYLYRRFRKEKPQHGRSRGRERFLCRLRLLRYCHGENSFGYIATWSKDKKLPELRASLETINKTASGLITDIDRNYAAICKERGYRPE
jgi:hypothetical protein